MEAETKEAGGPGFGSDAKEGNEGSGSFYGQWLGQRS